MIEGCKHGPENVIPQPCAECERERVSRERATHAFAAKLSALAQLGEDALQDAPANPMSLVPAVGDLGAEVAHWKARAEAAESAVARLTAEKDAAVSLLTDHERFSQFATEKYAKAEAARRELQESVARLTQARDTLQQERDDLREVAAMYVSQTLELWQAREEREIASQQALRLLGRALIAEQALASRGLADGAPPPLPPSTSGRPLVCTCGHDVNSHDVLDHGACHLLGCECPGWHWVESASERSK